MDWDEYKAKCAAPKVLSRWLLTQTICVVEERVAAELRSVLEGQPLVKPNDHKGNTSLDMFETSLANKTVLDIYRTVEIAIKNGRMTEGMVVRDYRSILRAWQEYLDAGAALCQKDMDT